MVPENHKNGNVSDADLDALLAEWAEAEIEPPAGFHEQTMKRLRAQARPVKKNNVISLFAKNRRWTSIAAAAVLMLFCVPVVQGQLGQNPTDQVMDVQQSVAVQNQETSVTETGDNTPQPAEQNSRMAEAKTESRNVVQSASPDKKTVMNAAMVPEAVQNTGGADVAAAPAAAADNQLMIAAFSLEEDTAAGNGKVRMAAEQPAAYSYVSDEDSLEALEQKLSDLEAILLGYQEKLAENPDDAELQKLVAEQQKAIDELKVKIEEMKQQAE